MADNTTLDPGAGGDTIRSEDRAGVKTQVVALDLNPAGSESLMAGTMPVTVGGVVEVSQSGSWSVSITGSVAVTGPLTDTELRASAVPVSGTFFQATQPVSLASVPTHAVTQSGAWSVTTGGLTDSELRASAVPVSLASVPTHAVTDGGGSLTVDGTFWQATQPVSLASVPSHEVTNAGTFAVQAAQSGSWSVTAAVVGTPNVNLADYGGVTLGPMNALHVQGGFGAIFAISAASLPLPTGAATEASLAAAAASLAVIDDWDSNDRAKVSPISGQDGVAAGAGAVGATVQRVTLASDDPGVASLGVLDDWDESDRAKVNPIVGQAGVQGGAGTSTALTQRVAIATDANAVDTELPAAALLADATALPTAPTIGAAQLTYNGATLDLKRGTVEGTALASAGRTATAASATLANHNCRGVICWLNVTANPGSTGTVQLFIQGLDPVSGNWINLAPTPTALAGVATTGHVLYPGATTTPTASAPYVFHSTGGVLPRQWRVNAVYGGSGTITYSVGYCLLP